MSGRGKVIGFLAAIVVVVFAVVYFGISATSNLGSGAQPLTPEEAAKKLDKLYSKIKVKTPEPIKGQIDLNPVDVAESLPDIDKFPVSVKSTTPHFVEIFSSPEKAGSGVDGWLNEVATDFNKAKVTVNGKPVSVMIRSINSGTAADYIKSGKYVPDAFTPSNELWMEMIKSGGIKTERISKSLNGNVPGIVIDKGKYDELKSKYGEVNIKTVTEAIAASELSMGYTDPFASSTGLNFLVAALSAIDSKNLLSDKAVEGFEKFQANVPFLALTTLQMREAAESGRLDAFVLEYQTFFNEAELRSAYEFVPFGVRHDSPLYALGDTPALKKQILKKFADFAAQDKYQKSASKYGFNQLADYKPEAKVVDGGTISRAQKLWKDKKNGGASITAVFVTDVSGSMSGEPINRLRQSLIQGQKYLGSQNSIGLVSYSDDVTINLPIGKYDTNQQSLFVGAAENLVPEGNTATFDGIVVAMKLLQDEIAANPNTKPVIFVLSDGDTNRGSKLKDVQGLIEAFKIPIYTIGYNADIEALQKISSINEAASINADTDDVVYKIGQLLNVQM
ncbi:substrate-binding and vWA domain-containing protein [Paenibacillus ihbetae]|uniref:VWFA domain-containing protein n=1 Tax=Paenibacillus ihbetae TaxID=1870820 RepID=A0A1B2E5H9_9BACL|nr:VWA domain-containing protein [Paenibacillus ihbetae]ANY75225.1 hypothetical protein BBD41_23090 [Paenibacillus ihbetae]OOC62599.1 hypothetical protein BBD40_12450 [Paenibacillus ihbetae]